MTLRPASALDWEEIRRICWETARHKTARASLKDRRFFAEIWVGPYQALAPDWSLVSVGGKDGRVSGYLTGCPDTRDFERRRMLRFTPRLVAKALSGRYGWGPDLWRFLRRMARIETAPGRRFEPSMIKRLKREYPAHLHMNIDAAARSGGLGRKLVERFAADLRAAGVPGMHLLCGEKAAGFYARVGFNEVARAALPEGGSVLAMGMRLDPP